LPPDLSIKPKRKFRPFFSFPRMFPLEMSGPFRYIFPTCNLMPIYQGSATSGNLQTIPNLRREFSTRNLQIGHINETYSATYDQGGMRLRYIHQKINQTVF